MWPKPGEALSRTLECEAALADLYQEALNRWVARTEPLVVSSLTASNTLPPDPDATEQNSQVWDDLSSEIILAGLSSLWALSLIESMTGLGLTLPAIALPSGRTVVISGLVARAISSTSSVAKRDILEAVERVESVPHLIEARDDFLATQRSVIKAAPALMHNKVTAAVRQPVELGKPYDVAVVIERQRAAATAVLTPGSEAVRDVARVQGYQAASVQNSAVIRAAAGSEDAETLDKTWIATIDGKTRPTHFAADGQRAPLGGSFTVGGEQLRFPGDPAGSPAEVKNCRCRVGVLAQDEEIPDEVDRHTERLGGRDSTARNRKGSQADEIRRRADDGTVRARDDEDGIGRTASVTPEQETTMTVITTTAEGIALASDDAETEGETFRTFTAQPIAFVGVETSDGRMLAKDIALTFRNPPMPVMWTKQTGYGHEDAFTVGVMESASLNAKTGEITASGYLLNSAESDEAAAQLEHTASRPSVDLARTEWILTVDGKEITEDDWYDLPDDAHIVQTVTAAELIGVTLVATPAFGDTMLQLNAEQEARDPALVASVANFQPRVYSAALFANPELTAPTLPTLDETTGRIFGHLACFNGCHRSINAPGECTLAPRSPSQYGNFHTSPAVRLDNGERLPVGRLTVGTGHYSTASGANPAAAVAHYDNTGTCFALVRMYEDNHGIAFSGVAAPWATPEQIEQGLASPLSGDWRNLDGRGLDLIAALAVNTPGFAIRGHSGSDGRAASLVASLGPAPRGRHQNGVQLSAETIGNIVETATARAVEAAMTARETKAEAEAVLALVTEELGPVPTPNEEIAELLAGLDA